MMKASAGNWSNKTILRASPGTNAIASEVVGTLLTGASSGASAVITAASSFAEGGAAIVEFELNPNSQERCIRIYKWRNRNCYFYSSRC